MPVEYTPSGPTSLRARIGSGNPLRATPAQVQQLVETKKLIDQEHADKAAYKIELLFSSHRSSLSHVASPGMLLIWESGKKLHGGGDYKMYWCGHRACQMPIPGGDLISHGFVVCRSCTRECFRSDQDRIRHKKQMVRDRKRTTDLDNIPTIGGEKMAKLTPSNWAKLLEQTFERLGREADIYITFSKKAIRYDAKNETVADLNNLDAVQLTREKVIYTLKAIRQDLAAGSGLHARFVAMLTS